MINADPVAVQMEKIPAKAAAYVYRKSRIQTIQIPTIGCLNVQKFFPPYVFFFKKTG